MVISPEYRYVFIEIPSTGSWSIRQELCLHYGGEPVLHKHASYPELLGATGTPSRTYFVFATIRHPLDHVVSRYFKLKTDKGGVFSDRSSVNDLRTDYVDHEKYRFVQDTGASFAEYFRTFHHRPYSNMIDLSRPYLDYVIRLEGLQEGFAEVLARLGIQQVRLVPQVNKTRWRRRRWQDHYSDDIIPQAKRTFGPLMKCWGYELPAEWGGFEHSSADELGFRPHRYLADRCLSYFRHTQGRPPRSFV
jgi:hypothetical protein